MCVCVCVCVAEYGVAKQAISDIRRNKEKICAYAAQVASDPKYTCKKIKTGQFVELQKAVLTSGIVSRNRLGLLCGAVTLRMLRFVLQFR